MVICVIWEYKIIFQETGKERWSQTAEEETRDEIFSWSLGTFFFFLSQKRSFPLSVKRENRNCECWDG